MSIVEININATTKMCCVPKQLYAIFTEKADHGQIRAIFMFHDGKSNTQLFPDINAVNQLLLQLKESSIGLNYAIIQYSEKCHIFVQGPCCRYVTQTEKAVIVILCNGHSMTVNIPTLTERGRLYDGYRDLMKASS